MMPHVVHVDGRLQNQGTRLKSHMPVNLTKVDHSKLPTQTMVVRKVSKVIFSSQKSYNQLPQQIPKHIQEQKESKL